MLPRIARIATTVVAALAIVAVTTTGVGAEPAPTLTITPLTGPAGTTIHVSGTGCPDPTWDTSLHWNVHVQTQPAGSKPSTGVVTPPSGTPQTPIGFTQPAYAGLAVAEVVAGPDGSWSADVTIPDERFAASPGDYPVSALCYATEGSEAGMIEYAGQTFVVVASPAPSMPPLAFTG